MTDCNTQAIVLRMGYFHERDVWLKVLCRQGGMQTVFAFGGAKSIHRFCGCLDVFNSLECHIRVSSNGKYLNLQEATLLYGPRKLRSDWRRMGIAANCIRFLEIMAQDGNEASSYFDLLENLRAVLECHSQISGLFPIFFRLTCASLAGYAPSLSICGKCGKDFEGCGLFSVEDGKVLCEGCAGQSVALGKSVFLSAQALKILRKVQFNLPENWPDATPEQTDKMACAMLINRFLEYHVGISLGEYGFQKQGRYLN